MVHRITLLLFLACAANAQTPQKDLASCPPDPTLSWIQIVRKECVGISETDIQQVLQELTFIRGLAGEVAIPTSLKVNPCAHRCMYDVLANQINITTDWKSYKTNKVMGRKYSYAVMAHEYGHVIFVDAMKKSSPRWDAHEKARNVVIEAADNLQIKIRTTEKNLPMKNGYPDWVLIEKTHPELKHAYQQVRTYLKAERVMHAYNEFFADALAVIYSNEPQIISVAVESGSSNERIQRIGKMRDFSSAIKRQEKRLWLQDLKKADLVDEGVAYEMLAPARHELWKQIKSKVTSDPGDQAKLIKKVFDSISKNFDSQFSSSQDFENLDFKKLNRSLKKSFREL